MRINQQIAERPSRVRKEQTEIGKVYRGEVNMVVYLATDRGLVELATGCVAPYHLLGFFEEMDAELIVKPLWP